VVSEFLFFYVLSKYNTQLGLHELPKPKTLHPIQPAVDKDAVIPEAVHNSPNTATCRITQQTHLAGKTVWRSLKHYSYYLLKPLSQKIILYNCKSVTGIIQSKWLVPQIVFIDEVMFITE
jgi:hypothetical protein